MPTYEYRCEKCEAEFERGESIREHETARPICPKCGSKRVARVPVLVYTITAKKS